MHAMIVALAWLAVLSPVRFALAKTCTVDAYGAIGDGVALDTAAIQRAADACTSNGTLTFTAGKRYLSGTFKLSGSVHVTLPYNTIVVASGLVRSHTGVQNITPVYAVQAGYHQASFAEDFLLHQPV